MSDNNNTIISYSNDFMMTDVAGVINAVKIDYLNELNDVRYVHFSP